MRREWTLPRFFDRPHIDPLILDFFNFAPKRCCLLLLLAVLLCEFSQPRLLLLHLELRHSQVFLGAAALAALHIVVPGVVHIPKEIVLQNAVGFLRTGLPFALKTGSPFSSSAGLESHFLLILTCCTVSLTVPTSDLSLQRFVHRICFPRREGRPHEGGSGTRPAPVHRTWRGCARRRA